MQFVTVSDLSKMLLKGTNRIIENKKKIDEINVFPVADSDSGSNLASTFLEIKQLLERRSFKSMQSLTDSVLEIAFVSSRGNSGIMMASFLKGFLLTLKNKDKIFLTDLAKAAKKGEEASRDSVEQPVRGAMLDVMDAFSDSLLVKKDKISIIDAFYQSTEKVKTALIKTEKKIKVLKKNHVVDAGALGFTFFVYGFYEGLSNKSLELENELDVLCHAELDSASKKIPKRVRNDKNNIGKFPHEVIFTVQNSVFKVDQIRTMLSPMGDCLDIIEMKERVKIHIHTDKPDVVKETASLTGEIVDIKIQKL